MNRSREVSFSPRWIALGLGVIVLAGIFIRLGFWQLDRLSQRKALNARLESRMSAPAAAINSSSEVTDPAALEFRTVSVTGEYDFVHQVALANRTYQGRLGIDLLTPLVIQGSQKAVLVDRGWIPFTDLQRSTWAKYDQPGQVTLTGMVLLDQPSSGPAIPATGGNQASRQDLWSSPEVEKIQSQVPEPLFPFYVHELPEPVRTGLPYAQAPQIDLSNGPHLGYAIEWFSFAAIVLVGFPFWIKRQFSQPVSRKNEILEPDGIREAAKDQKVGY